MAAVQQLMNKIKTPISDSAMLYLVLTLVLVHLPLCALRKVRSGVLTCRLLYQAAAPKA